MSMIHTRNDAIIEKTMVLAVELLRMYITWVIDLLFDAELDAESGPDPEALFGQEHV
jgi:hypothetical protein